MYQKYVDHALIPCNALYFFRSDACELYYLKITLKVFGYAFELLLSTFQIISITFFFSQLEPLKILLISYSITIVHLLKVLASQHFVFRSNYSYLSWLIPQFYDLLQFFYVTLV